MKGKKQERPLGLDMDFGEALNRFIGTDPAEVAESIKTAKEKRLPPDGQEPPAGDKKATRLD